LGFTAPGHECGASETQQVFRGNVAHSINGLSASGKDIGGTGALVYPDPVSKTQGGKGKGKCFEISHFAAYKVRNQGLVTSFQSEKVIVNGVISLDNGEGMLVNVV